MGAEVTPLAPPATPPISRDGLLADAAHLGIDAIGALLVDDLARHAAKQALCTIDRIARTAPEARLVAIIQLEAIELLRGALLRTFAALGEPQATIARAIAANNPLAPAPEESTPAEADVVPPKPSSPKREPGGPGQQLGAATSAAPDLGAAGAVPPAPETECE